MAYDVLLKRGTLIDPSQGIHAVKDIAFAEGKVAEIGDNLTAPDGSKALDCAEHIISPGWVDLHVHIFWGCSHYGIEPDRNCVGKGVTTALDAGSAGADTFPGLRKYVMEASDTRLFAFLHISSQGLLTREIGELDNLKYADVSKAIEMIEKNRDLILGVKVRLTKTFVNKSAGLRPLHLAREAADAVGLPIMVHPQDAWCDDIDDILAVMGTDDILTHCFHGLPCGIFDEKGKLRRSVREAMDRGVLFDVGHGRRSFNWKIVENALRQGARPHTISSDLHAYNVDGPVFDLATTVSKFLHLGLSLDEALAGVTVNPAKVIGISNTVGTLKVGAWGDAVVLKLEEGAFNFFDAHGECRVGSRRLVPVIVVRAGRVYKGNL